MSARRQRRPRQKLKEPYLHRPHVQEGERAAVAQGKAIHSDEELARVRRDLEALRTESRAALTQQQQRTQALETELHAATKALEAARQERDTAYAGHSYSI